MTQQPSERRLLNTFYAGAALLAIYVLFLALQSNLLHVVAGSIILFAALFPSYLWCAGKVRGLPIFPALALTYSWTFGLPLLSDHPSLARYDPATLVQSILTVVLFLIVATTAWYVLITQSASPPRLYMAVPAEGSSPIFLACLMVGCIFQIASMEGLLWDLGPSVYSLLRSVCLALAVIAVTVLSYRLGCRDLGPLATVAFLGLLLVYIVFNAAGLMLAPSMALLLLSTSIFTVARGKFPLPVVALAAVLFGVLHVGKKPMRDEYWGKGKAIQLSNDPAYYLRWFAFGLQRLPQSFSGERIDKAKQASLTERASVIQMLLLVQSQSPSERPFLYGRTYSIIPELLVPRILTKDKLWSHEGTYILAIHYGLQTRSTTRKTTIGFGLLPEAYANFGYAGVLGLALFLGAFTGLVTRWSQMVPVVSLRGMYALMVLGLGMQTEHTAGVVVSSLFQASVTLLGLAILTMRIHEQPAALGSPVHAHPAGCTGTLHNTR